MEICDAKLFQEVLSPSLTNFQSSGASSQNQFSSTGDLASAKSSNGLNLNSNSSSSMTTSDFMTVSSTAQTFSECGSLPPVHHLTPVSTTSNNHKLHHSAAAPTKPSNHNSSSIYGNNNSKSGKPQQLQGLSVKMEAGVDKNGNTKKSQSTNSSPGQSQNPSFVTSNQLALQIRAGSVMII